MTIQLVEPAKLYEMLQNKEIMAIARALLDYGSMGALSDIQPFINTFNCYFAQEIIRYELKDLCNLENIFMVVSRYTVLSTSNYRILLEKIFDLTEDSEKKFKYACLDSDFEKFKVYIDNYTKNKSVEIEHKMSDKICLAETNSCNQTEDFTIGLFKSKQEKQFFTAARSVFPNCFVFPNVAISCLVNGEKAMELLNKEEKDYFYKGVVDCVIYEIDYDEDGQYTNFKPLYFFELDSIYHDAENQKHNDCLKDSIFGKVGLKVIRIRSKNDTLPLSVEDFENLIIEYINSK